MHFASSVSLLPGLYIIPTFFDAVYSRTAALHWLTKQLITAQKNVFQRIRCHSHGLIEPLVNMQFEIQGVISGDKTVGLGTGISLTADIHLGSLVKLENPVDQRKIFRPMNGGSLG